MMKYIKSFLLLVLMSIAVKAQPARDISLVILNKKGRPINNIIVRSVDNKQVGLTDRSGLFVFTGMTDSDMISMILPKYGETIVPVEGMDSIVVTLRSARRYSYVSNEGSHVVIDKNKVEPNDLLDVPALLKKHTYRSLSELLQGRVPGLVVNTAPGPRGTTTANIRGESSMGMSSSEPLVVLNGTVIGTLDIANNMVNIHEIQSIEVQKNGSAWGVRGANGVILIKTK